MQGEVARATLEEFIADAEGVGGDWGRILFRRAAESKSIDWERVASEVAKASNFPIDRFAGMIKDSTIAKPGSRRFLIQPKVTNVD